MMRKMSQLADDYGIDVWIWHSALGVDHAQPATVDSALKEWGEVYLKLPRVDAVFVPSGDPGRLEPKHLMAFLEKAADVFRRAPLVDSLVAMDKAERILDRAVLAPVAQDLRARVFELAEALYPSIRMRLSVPRYEAIHIDRGANLDLIDVPLDDRLWLKARFAELRWKDTDRQRQQGISEIVNWTDPGPGVYPSSCSTAGVPRIA